MIVLLRDPVSVVVSLFFFSSALIESVTLLVKSESRVDNKERQIPLDTGYWC
jgi:hypothetical protein